MSDNIKHECGIAFIRLRKPLKYYQEKYGTWAWGINRLYLLMEKQHNRGQDGAGLVTIKINAQPGSEYIHRMRSNLREPIKDVFQRINRSHEKFNKENNGNSVNIHNIVENMPFVGELMLGHLRYGTFGRNDLKSVHPVIRQNNWKSKSLCLAGNFNMTNVDEIFEKLLYLGQHPRDYSDTVSILENIGHFLDDENERVFQYLKEQGYTKRDSSPLIEEHLNLKRVLGEASKKWDGGYVIAGLLGHGDSFIARDPWGIRPAFYYSDDEIVVAASERPVIQTVFNVDIDEVKELKPGFALITKKDGSFSEIQVRETQIKSACSFERIYFSRGSDKDIYQERKKLGELITPKIIEAVDDDLKNTVFSFIPNTAETAFYGMVHAVENHIRGKKVKQIFEQKDNLTKNQLREIISERTRVEKIAIKDIKLRTFITQDADRDNLVNHVYDITYGTVNKNTDNLVVIDDSIVRGTTLKVSIIKILSRLKPKKIVIVSSSPQIRYPDCYGIDMANLKDFIAFKAAIELLKDTNQEHIIEQVYEKSKAQIGLPKEEIFNFVKEIYAPFTDEEISNKIAEILKTDDVKPKIEVIYQTVENLHKAIPNHTGDWYFTGNYPTPGGNKVVNTAFINYYEKKNQRAY